MVYSIAKSPKLGTACYMPLVCGVLFQSGIWLNKKMVINTVEREVCLLT